MDFIYTPKVDFLIENCTSKDCGGFKKYLRNALLCKLCVG